MSIFSTVIDALNRTGARYVVVGGFAANLHGHVRFTSDLDLMIDLAPRSANRLIQALFDLGFQPRVPVTPADFADVEIRSRWIREKGAKVISFVHPEQPVFAVDVFVDPPIDFDELYATSKVVSLGLISTRIASLDDLIRLKAIAGRPQDVLDIEVLTKLRN